MNIGLPTPGYEFAIIDAETGEQCPPEVNGEFCLRGTRGVQLFYEYYKNPEANEKSFTADGWFKTGDMVRLGTDGYFYFSDRDKDLLKVGAENVSARQVEEVIYELQGCFDEVAVVAQKHDMLDEVPVVFAIKSPYSQESEEQLREKLLAHCESKLADFKRPRAVYFMEEFPRVTLEKTAKNKLRDLANQYAEEQGS
jgi:crotonobetaine/carnitine-CoA ligase